LTKCRHNIALYAATIISMILSGLSCGPGFDGYADQYSDVAPVSLAPWEGDETVFVDLEGQSVEVELAGMETYDYEGAPAVSLAELILSSGITQTPESFRYDFTASDGYNLFTKRHEDLDLMPSWTEMQVGFLYLDPRYDDLTSGWAEHPWGSALSAYQVKWFNGGTITLLSIE
jgi:hypothetical protein